MSACSNAHGRCARDPDCEDRHCPGRYGFPTSRRHPRTLAEAFPDMRRQFLEPHIAPSFWQRVRLFFRRRFA